MRAAAEAAASSSALSSSSRELVAAEAAHDRAAPGGGCQALTHRAQHSVAGGMAVSVVHLLEAVEVEGDHACGRPAPTAAASTRRLLLEPAPVQAAGERVRARRAGELLTLGTVAARLPEERGAGHQRGCGGDHVRIGGEQHNHRRDPASRVPTPFVIAPTRPSLRGSGDEKRAQSGFVSPAARGGSGPGVRHSCASRTR